MRSVNPKLNKKRIGRKEKGWMWRREKTKREK